jgi:hypothetical protein
MKTSYILTALALFACSCASPSHSQAPSSVKEITLRITGEAGQSYHGTLRADGITTTADGKTPGEHKVTCRELDAVFEKGPEPGNLQITILTVGQGGSTTLATALAKPGGRCHITSRKHELGARCE